MRARNIKPSLFKNELLATADPLNAWIFEGLWCLADRDGRLQDRPRRIHLEINPGRAYEGTESALAWLAEQGFIVRYKHGGGEYIQVVNFSKHQNPHMREPASVIPGPSIGTHEHHSSTVLAPGTNGAGPALSPSLIPDSPSLKEETHASRATHLPSDFDLTPQRRAVAEAEKRDPDRTFANFCDYWRSASGARARKRDWDATWRVWCRNERSGNGTHQRVAKQSAVERVYAATAHLVGDSGRVGVEVDGPDVRAGVPDRIR